jgi:DNA-binding Lrp family transcriptional regulator
MPHTASNTQKSRGRPRRLGDQEILVVLRARGGTARFADVARAVTASEPTIHRRLDEMVKAGSLSRPQRGTYVLVNQSEQVTATAYRIVAVLRDCAAEAHLTGYDVLATHSHQFMRQWPHLVYADPAAIDDVSHALSQAGFNVLPAKDAGVASGLSDANRVVVIRGQSPSRMDRFSAYGRVAPIEKAWIDLLREVRIGWFPLSLADVGAILASMLRNGVDEARIASYARESGYGHYLQHLPAGSPPDSPIAQLHAGMRR